MKVITLLILTFLINFSFAQSFVDEFEDQGSLDSFASDLPTEKITKISTSGRIIILTNSNQSFQKGDFISLVHSNKLVTRALVAKDTSDVSGIKILKIYSMELFKELRLGTEVKVIRGDDSFFKVKKKEKEEEATLINSEEDLYSTELLDDNLEIEDNKNRAIKTDNIISANLGFLSTLDKDKNTSRTNLFNATWAYQFDDNIWGEALYGEGVLQDFPDDGLGTKITTYTIRAKYTFAGPMFTYFQPYLGFQIVNADSPGAGVQDPDDPKTDTELQNELNLVSEIQKKQVVFGVTVLKRLVPGWFLRADFGNDILNVGFSLEF